MNVYLQYSNGNEETLKVTEPDPNDGTLCIHLPESLPESKESDGTVITKWIRINPKQMFMKMIESLPEDADTSVIDEMIDFLTEQMHNRMN